VTRPAPAAFWPGAYQLAGSVPLRLMDPNPYQVLIWLKAALGIWKRGTKFMLTELSASTFSPVELELSRSLPIVLTVELVTYSMVWISQLELKPLAVV